MNWGVAAGLNVIFAVICVLYGFLHNQQINSLYTYYTPQWQRPFIILLMVILFVHNQERLQRKEWTVEMWMKILHNGTAFYNVPCMYTTIKKTLSLKTVLKRRSGIFSWIQYISKTIYGELVVDEILYQHTFKFQVQMQND